MHMWERDVQACGDQKTICKYWFFPSIIWVPGIKLGGRYLDSLSISMAFKHML